MCTWIKRMGDTKWSQLSVVCTVGMIYWWLLLCNTELQLGRNTCTKLTFSGEYNKSAVLVSTIDSWPLRQLPASVIYIGKGVLPRVSCSSKAYDWTTGRKRSHSNSNQLTDKIAAVTSQWIRAYITQSAISRYRSENESVDEKICRRAKNRESRSRHPVIGGCRKQSYSSYSSALWCKLNITS